MPSTRDLRRRIRSVKNTAQITKAMQMVSATKMRRAQTQALSSRPYAQLFTRVLEYLSKQNNTISHPLLLGNDSKKIAVVVFSTDKGLCGALNTNIIRLLLNHTLFKDEVKLEDVEFFTIGKKVRDFIVRTKRNLKGDFENHEKVEFRHAVSIRRTLLNEFKLGNIGQIYLLYPNFISTLRQEPKLVRIVPITLEALQEIASMDLEEKENSQVDSEHVDFLFEPDISTLLDYVLVHYIDIQIYKALLEVKASEHSARMIAMQNATDNAKDLVTELTLTYNGLRQENITRELLEITSASAALE